MTTFNPGAGCLNSPFALRSAANTWSNWLVTMAIYSGPSCTGTYLGSAVAGQPLPYLSSPALSVYTVV